jgi:hypothetical protein
MKWGVATIIPKKIFNFNNNGHHKLVGIEAIKRAAQFLETIFGVNPKP